MVHNVQLAKLSGCPLLQHAAITVSLKHLCSSMQPCQVLRPTCNLPPPGINTENVNDLLQPPPRAASTFKAKSFNAVKPLNNDVLLILQRAVLADSRGWVQFEAYGVKALSCCIDVVPCLHASRIPLICSNHTCLRALLVSLFPCFQTTFIGISCAEPLQTVLLVTISFGEFDLDMPQVLLPGRLAPH